VLAAGSRARDQNKGQRDAARRFSTHGQNDKEVLNDVETLRMEVIPQDYTQDQTDRLAIRSNDEDQHVIRSVLVVFWR